MERKFTRALLWVLIALLAIGISTDWLVLLGCNRGGQYIYNFVAFCAIWILLVPALGDKPNKA